MTLQYYVTNLENFKPYIGASVNYTIFYQTDANENNAGIGLSYLYIDNSWGYALQAGFDYMLKQH
ncbi:hypothetical protein MEG_00111 [Bartonella tamiae Th307]|uniref:Uncharacterized protein n=1 Tax=Bartonella tamiae Th239 TaxID=1094558 RepID=J0ZLD2_9HYPH|nr:hypothetical protein ME5_01769 [Bartonella tamiae Th239]EJF95378.1 hypothetical protein MEG_00111 [Bartonella tamiae Th307]